MPFKFLNPPPTKEAPVNAGSSSPSSPVVPPQHGENVSPEAPAGGCRLTLVVNEKERSYKLNAPPGSPCGSEYQKLRNFGLGTRRNVADHTQTDDEGLRRLLDELKKRKGENN